MSIIPASAFNEVKAGTNVFTSGDVILIVNCCSKSYKGEFVVAVSHEVTNVDARIDADGAVVFQMIQICYKFCRSTELGITADAYGGFTTSKLRQLTNYYTSWF